MAEKLALEQAGGNGGAIQLDEGVLAALAQAMNGAREQFFAGSGFALDEDGGIGGRNGLNLPQHIAQAGAFAHDVVETVFDIDLVFEILLFLAEPVAQFRDSAEGDGVVDRHRHLAGNLDQHLHFALPETALLAWLTTDSAPSALPW